MTNYITLITVAALGGIAVALQGQFMGMMDQRLGTKASVFITYASGGLVVDPRRFAFRRLESEGVAERSLVCLQHRAPGALHRGHDQLHSAPPRFDRSVHYCCGCAVHHRRLAGSLWLAGGRCAASGSVPIARDRHSYSWSVAHHEIKGMQYLLRSSQRFLSH